MQLSYAGLTFLKEREGFRNTAYRDTGGVWTVGYGTIRVNGKPVEPGMQVDSRQAEEALREDLSWAQTAINKLVRVPLTQVQFDALTSFVYNIGENAFSKSTLLRVLNMGLYHEAAKQFDRWVYDNGRVIRGLVVRRKLERDMFERSLA